MTTTLARSIALCLACWLASACAPTETGNPSLTTTTSASLVAYSSDPSVIGVRAQNGARVDELWLSYASVDLADCQGGPASTAVTGPISEDLTVRPPASHELETDIDVFCRIEIPLTLASSPAVVADSVIAVTGHRADDVGFAIRSRAIRQFVLDASPAGVAVGEESPKLLVAFDVSRWFATLDLASATPGPDGVVHVDDTANPALLLDFEAALDHSATLHRDIDRDGVLDPDELAIAH